LSHQARLETIITDKELLKQYRIKYGSEAVYELTKDRDVWHCVCGALNHQNEESCHKCGKIFVDLNNVDFTLLEAEKDIRLKNEADKLAELQALKIEKQQKSKRNAKIATPFVVALIILAVIVFGNIRKNNSYNEAIEFLSVAQYDEAYAIFEELGDYKDSSKYLECFILVPTEIRNDWEYTTLIYDQNGRIIKEITKGYSDDFYDSERTFTYNDVDGSLTVVDHFAYSRTGNVKNWVTETTIFNSDRSEAKFTREGNFPTKYFNLYYTYDTYGNVLTAKSINSETNAVEYNREYYYEYDNDGKLLSSCYSRDSSGSKWNYIEYTYDENNLLTKTTTFNDVKEYSYGLVYNINS